MKVETILKDKGRNVETVQPEASMVMVVHKLSTMGIGALVVSSDGQRVDGIVNERDVVRGLNRHGVRLLDMQAKDVMSRGMPLCSPDDTLRRVMEDMTRTRNRHVPVVEDGRLCGLISIGDVVKNLVEEVELEVGVLRDAYISGRRPMTEQRS
jgi:CBS domain-containing protein